MFLLERELGERKGAGKRGAHGGKGQSWEEGLVDGAFERYLLGKECRILPSLCTGQ